MSEIKLPAKGKFTIETVGPVETKKSKKTGKDYTTYTLQFEGDPNWYKTFWTQKEKPEAGNELEGTKSFNEDYNTYQFEMAWSGGNKQSWNPAGANATVMGVAAQITRDMFALGVVTKENWAKKRQQNETPEQQYIRTVVVLAGILKTEVAGMGSTNEVKKAETTSSAPRSNGDPGPGDVPPPDDEWPGEEPVDI